MEKRIIITADTNDADYVTSINAITDEDIELIKPVVEAIKNFKPYKAGGFTHSHNFPSGEHFPRTDMGEKTTEELYGHLEGYDLFQDLCPYGEHGIHTIDEVEIYEIVNEIKLL
jgi:hypothetical protein